MVHPARAWLMCWEVFFAFVSLMAASHWVCFSADTAQLNDAICSGVRAAGYDPESVMIEPDDRGKRPSSRRAVLLE
jgi:hypothetical protein